MSIPDKDANVYGTLKLFKEQYDKRFLIRIGTIADQEPEDYIVEINGTHTGGNGSANLIDSAASFLNVNKLEIGMIVKNVTDGSEGPITAIISDTELTATLAGGNNNWDADDVWTITDNRIDRKLQAALEDAADQMDKYLIAQTPTPVEKWPDYFEKDNYCIAVYILIRAKGYDKDTSDHQAVLDGKDCLKDYKAIAKGDIKLSLPDDSGQATVPANTVACAQPKIFGASVLNAFNLGNRNRPGNFDRRPGDFDSNSNKFD